MSTEENKALIRRFYEEGWNEGNVAVAEEIFAPTYVLHDPALPGLPPGPEGVKQVLTLYRTAFPDAHLTVEDIVVGADGEKFVSRWTARGTHQGQLRNIAPTGKPILVTGIAIWHIVDGKVVERWENWDTLGLFQQIGATITPPEPAS